MDISALSAAAVPVLGALIWWLFKSRLSRDAQEHTEMRTSIGRISETIVDQSGKTVSVDDCRVCHSSTLNSIQAVQVRLSTIQESVADVRERVADGMGRLSGKIDTLSRLLAAKTDIRDK